MLIRLRTSDWRSGCLPKISTAANASRMRYLFSIKSIKRGKSMIPPNTPDRTSSSANSFPFSTLNLLRVRLLSWWRPAITWRGVGAPAATAGGADRAIINIKAAASAGATAEKAKAQGMKSAFSVLSREFPEIFD